MTLKPRLHAAVNKGGSARGRNCDNSYCNVRLALFLHDVVTVVVDCHVSTVVFLRNGERTARAKRAHVRSMRE